MQRSLLPDEPKWIHSTCDRDGAIIFRHRRSVNGDFPDTHFPTGPAAGTMHPLPLGRVDEHCRGKLFSRCLGQRSREEARLRVSGATQFRSARFSTGSYKTEFIRIPPNEEWVSGTPAAGLDGAGTPARETSGDDSGSPGPDRGAAGGTQSIEKGVETVRGFGRLFKQAAGRSSSLVDAAARRWRRWFQGKAAARTAFV